MTLAGDGAHDPHAAACATRRRLRVGLAGSDPMLVEALARLGSVLELRFIETSPRHPNPGSATEALGDPLTTRSARRARDVDPDLCVRVFDLEQHAHEWSALLEGLDVVIDQWRCMPAKIELREEARLHRAALVDATPGTGLVDVERFDLEPERAPFHGRLEDELEDGLDWRDPEIALAGWLKLFGIDELPASSAALVPLGHGSPESVPVTVDSVLLQAAVVCTLLERLAADQPVFSGRYGAGLELSPRERTSARAPAPASASHAAKRVAERARTDAGWWSLVSAAAAAPSLGNSQPWRFLGTEHVLRLFVSPERTPGRIDASLRASLIACGAALENLEHAADAAGWSRERIEWPRGVDDLCVAEIRLDARSASAPAAELRALGRRYTNRRPGTGEPIDARTRQRLCRASESAGVHVRWIESPAGVGELAALLGAADAVRRFCPVLGPEWIRQLRWRPEDAEWTSDGIDIDALALSSDELVTLRLMKRTDVVAAMRERGVDRIVAARTERLASTASAFAVLVADGTGSPADFVRGGRGLERLWLEAGMRDVAVHPMTPVFLYGLGLGAWGGIVSRRDAARIAELATRFSALAELAAGDVPIAVLRLGFAPPPPVRSIRRPLEAILAPE